MKNKANFVSNSNLEMIGPFVIFVILDVKFAVCTPGCWGREKLGGGSETPPPPTPHKNKKKKDHSKQEPITQSEQLPCACVTGQFIFRTVLVQILNIFKF